MAKFKNPYVLLPAAITLAVVVAYSLFTWATAPPSGVEVADYGPLLARRIYQAEPGDQISLPDPPGIDRWQDVVIVGPYPKNEMFARVTGIEWDAETAGRWTEGTTFAFVYDRSVVGWAWVPHEYLSEQPLENWAIKLGRDEARFTVVVDGSTRQLHLP